MFHPNTTNSPTFSAKLKLKSLLLITFMTSKSIWKKMLNFWLASYTLFQYLNRRLWKNSLRKTLIQILSDQSHLCTVYQSYLLKKKDGSLHLYVNFCSLNHISKNCCLFLLISNLLDSSYKAWIYSKIDLCHAYHLVRITDSDEWKTAFRTHYRSFKWSIMPFGLTNTLMAFQQFMNDIFSNLLDVCVMIYLDDILIYLNNMSEHYWCIKKVLNIFFLLLALPCLMTK